uniref:Uncharacterized protein n=1 Tax=Trichuris muris TaxID=70415 RepID=A0A5S6QNH5_TRIMR
MNVSAGMKELELATPGPLWWQRQKQLALSELLHLKHSNSKLVIFWAGNKKSLCRTLSLAKGFSSSPLPKAQCAGKGADYYSSLQRIFVSHFRWPQFTVSCARTVGLPVVTFSVHMLGQIRDGNFCKSRRKQASESVELKQAKEDDGHPFAPKCSQKRRAHNRYGLVYGKLDLTCCHLIGRKRPSQSATLN